ncbi:MAG: dihydrofolate reductase [Saprospiraceae bacterium]|nr:dihydrofolate reductase [Saprospiraceae bacterium]
MIMERKVILYIAMSLDGYIAKPDDDLGFLSIVEKEGEDYGYSDFVSTVDAVILGRRTYDKVLSMRLLISRTATRMPTSSLGRRGTHWFGEEFYTGSLPALVANLKAKQGKHIFVDGGAAIVHELLKHDLIDEFYISIIPILLGEGISLFKNGRPELKLKLMSTKQFDTGLAQLHYVK